MQTHSTTSNATYWRWAGIGMLMILTIQIISSAFLYSRQQRIGFVRSSELVDGYLGMKEARNQYQNKSQKWQANVDTLEQDFKKTLHHFQYETSGLSVAERRKKEETLKQMQENLFQYTSSVRENARTEDEKLTQGVLNQINSFVQEYGKSQGFDVILGTTLSGSLLYGEEQLDITDQVLTALNRNYRPAGVASAISSTQKADHAQ